MPWCAVPPMKGLVQYQLMEAVWREEGTRKECTNKMREEWMKWLQCTNSQKPRTQKSESLDLRLSVTVGFKLQPTAVSQNVHFFLSFFEYLLYKGQWIYLSKNYQDWSIIPRFYALCPWGLLRIIKVFKVDPSRRPTREKTQTYNFSGATWRLITLLINHVVSRS